MSESNNFLNLVDLFQLNIDNLNTVLLGDKNATITSGGVQKPSISKDIEDRFVTLKVGQRDGVIVFTTYAELDAYTPTTAQEKASFKVTNDTDTSLNGYYSWGSGTAYTKDASLVTGVVDPANTSDAVSGKAVIDVTKTKADLSLGKNHFDLTSITDNAYLSASNIATNDNGFYYSDYIAVEPFQQYSANSVRFVTYFDIDKNYVSGGEDTTVQVFTIPSDVYFIRVTGAKTVVTASYFQLEKGPSSTEYEPYAYEVPALQTKTVSNKIDMFFSKLTEIMPKNLYEGVRNTGSYIDESGAVVTTTYDLFYSSLISVNRNFSSQLTLSIDEEHSLSVSNGWRFLAEDGVTVLLSGLLTTTRSYTLNIPAAARYFQFSGANTGIFFQVEYGDSFTEYYVPIADKVIDVVDRVAHNTASLDDIIPKNLYGGVRNTGSYIDGSGIIVVSEYDVFYSSLISVNRNFSNQLTVSIDEEHSLSVSHGWRFLAEDGTTVLLNGLLTATRSYTLNIPDSAFYFQFTGPNTGIYFQVEYGVSFTEYEEPIADKVTTVIDRVDKHTAMLAEIIPKNLYAGVRNTGSYLDASGAIVTTNYDLFYSSLISVNRDFSDQLTVSIDAEHSLNATNGWRFLAEDGVTVILSGLLTTTRSYTLNIPAAARYFQFSGSNLGIYFQVEYGDSFTEYEEFAIDLSEYIPTKLPMANSVNIFDRNYLLNEYGYLASGVLTSTSFALRTSRLIPLDNTESFLTYSENGDYHTTSSGNGWRFLGKDGVTVISYGIPSTGSTNYTLAIPIQAYYFQFGFSEPAVEVQLEYGEAVTAYELYHGVAFETGQSYLDLNENLKVTLPSTVYVTKNDGLTLYHDSYIGKSYKNDVDVRLDGVSATYNYRNQALINANTLGADTLDVQILNSDFTGYKTLKIQSIEVVDKPIGKTVKMLAIGDSFTEIGKTTQEIFNKITSHGATPVMVGAMRTINGDDSRSENQTGGTLPGGFLNSIDDTCYVVDAVGMQFDVTQNYTQYVTVYDDNGVSWVIWGTNISGGDGKVRLFNLNTVVVLPPSGTLTGGGLSFSYSGAVEVNKNPFWDVTTAQLNFTKYFTLWGFDIPDIVILQFMWNDCGDWGSGVTSLVANTKIFIDQFRSEYPNTKFIFSVESSTAKFDNSVNTQISGRDYTVLKLTEELVTQFELHVDYAGSVYVAPSYACVDRINGFDSTLTALSPRYPDVLTAVGNASRVVHPNTGGMEQIADAITPVIYKIAQNL